MHRQYSWMQVQDGNTTDYDVGLGQEFSIWTQALHILGLDKTCCTLIDGGSKAVDVRCRRGLVIAQQLWREVVTITFLPVL